MSRIDIMVDLETLGRTGEYTVFQIGAVAFDIETGEVKNEFDMTADIELNEFCSDKDFKVEPETLMWWLKTDKELLYKLLSENDGCSSYEIFQEFDSWIYDLNNMYNEVYLWGNGILFDNKIIKEKMDYYGIEYPISYKNDRDLRTIVDLATNILGITEKELKEKFDDDSLTKHNGLDDCKYQVKLLVYCWNLLTKRVR
jgi:hypothetical protein